MNAIETILQARERLDAGTPAKAIQKIQPSMLKGPFRLSAGLVLGDAWRARGYFRKAIEAYRAALKGAPQDDPEVFEASLGLAAALRTVGRPSEAEAALKSALRLASKGMRDEKWRVDMEAAMIARAKGDFDACLKGMRALRTRFHKEGDRAAESFALWAMGGALRFRGDLKDGVATFRLAVKAARAGGDPLAEGYALSGLAGALRIGGDLEGCFKTYRQAAKLFDRHDDDFGAAYANCGTANGLRALGRFREAERFYRRAYTLYAGLDDLVDLGYVEWGLGKTLERLGKLQEALAWIEKSQRHFDAFDEERGSVLALLARAGLEHALGRTKKGEALFAQGYALAKKHWIHTHLEIFT